MNEKSTIKINKFDFNSIIKLEQVECAASCLLTILKLFKQNETFFLSNYWSLNYFNNLVMGSKRLIRCNLDYFYHFGIKYKECKLNELKNDLKNGNIVLLICKASDFKYFPENLLILENIGIFHVIILYSYNEIKKSFLLIDPIVMHIEDILEENLIEIIEKNGNIIKYLRLNNFNNNYNYPDNKTIFKFIATNNYFSFVNSDSMTGINSFDMLQKDLEFFMEKSVNDRKNWIYSNNITITSLIKVRKIIWANIIKMNILKDKHIEELNLMFNEIFQNWNSLNFLLSKYMIKESQEVLKKLIYILTNLKLNEISFLEKIKNIACKM